MRLAGRFVASILALMLALPAQAQTTTAMPSSVVTTVAGHTAVPTANPIRADAEVDADREALLPIGARMGSFFLYPTLEGAVTYNDNVYALRARTGDIIGRVSPSLDLRGDFGSVTTAMRTRLDRYEYRDRKAENRTDWNIGGNLQDEVKRDRFLYLAGGYSRAHEDRGDPNALSTDRSPTRYYLTEAGAGASSDATRVSYGADISYRRYHFVDNRQIGGAIVNNADRDRDQYRVAGRIGYEFSPGYRLLGRASYENVVYDQRYDDASFQRDNHGVRGTLGIQFELSRLLQGEVFGGYLNRRYRDPRFRHFATPVYGSRLTWRPTALATIRLDIDRTVLETVAADYSGFVSTTYVLGADYEMLRTVILSASARFGTDRYRRGSAIVAPRRDDTYGCSAGARYALNRNVYAGLNYDWSRRASTVTLPGTNFARNRVSASLGLQF